MQCRAELQFENRNQRKCRLQNRRWFESCIDLQ
ncbi:hypothetical protein AB3N59_04135 [Leptospira sp. WS92.C1]